MMCYFCRYFPVTKTMTMRKASLVINGFSVCNNDDHIHAAEMPSKADAFIYLRKIRTEQD
jgi:hypothetical protein